MGSELSIRPAREWDLERIAFLEQAAFPDPWPRDLIAHELLNPQSLLLLAAREGEEPVGYASFRHAADESELLRLAVLPEERRQGVARALLQQGIARLRSAGIQTCFLEVRENNHGAIALYQNLGFDDAGRRRAYYRDGTDALIYVLPL